MSPSTSDLGVASQADPKLAALIDELTDRLQAGEAVDLESYLGRHPEHAEPLRQLIPALEMMGELKRSAARAAACPVAEGRDPRLEAGVLGDFRIVREVGRGGMGVVYEAEQISLHRRVALKILPLAGAMDSKQLQRFQLEAQAAACLHHTHIVPVHAVGCERGVPFYAMQYIEGRSLAQLIAELRRAEGVDAAGGATSTLAAGVLSGRFSEVVGPAGPAEPGPVIILSPSSTSGPADPTAPRPRPGDGPSSDSSTRSRHYLRTVAGFGVQVAEALDHAHTRGILHRDIKPGNLLLDDQGQLWVADFGLAQVQGNPCLTLTGDVLGTLRYMSPEQALARRVVIDGRTDIYSLGVTLYELLTLRPAVDGQDRQEILRKIAEEEPVSPRGLNPAVPCDLETIVLKAVAKEPSGRYGTAKELADELRRFLEDKPITARRPSLLDRAAKWARRHRHAVWSTAVSLLLAVAMLTGSIGWIVRDRAARSEMTTREVNRALSEATANQGRAKWPEALEAARRAEGFLAVGAGETLRRRVHELRKDLEMVLRLEEIWLPRAIHGTEGYYDKKWADASYAEAFREYGIDVDVLEPAEAAGRIRARTIGLELAVALDLWADRRERTREAGDASWKRLLAVARAADPDAWRNRVRDARERRDRATVTELVAAAPVGDLPVQTLSLLCELAAISEQTHLMLRRAQREHPDDFHLNFQLAWNLDHGTSPYLNLDEAIRFYTAALAVRPRNAPTWVWLGDALRARGTLDEAITAYRKAIALGQDSAMAYLRLGDALQSRGMVGEARAALEEVIRSGPNGPHDLNEVAWFLATCSRAELRDPRRAVEFASQAVVGAPRIGDYWNTLGLAHYRAGNWDGAIAALEKSVALRFDGGDSFDWLFLAMSHWRLGERDKARHWYDRAVQWMEERKPKDDDLLRFRAEADELLQITTPKAAGTDKGRP